MNKVICNECRKSFVKTYRYPTHKFCSKKCHTTFYKKRTFDRFKELAIMNEGQSCWGWRGDVDAAGYGHISKYTAYRISYELFKGKIKKGMHVLHKCDNRICANPEHLYLGSHHDNMMDMVRRRRYEYGERHHNSKLNDAKVIEIRRLIGIKTQKEIAHIFNVDPSLITGIKSKRYWSHI